MPELTVNTVKKVKDLDLIFGVLGADVDLRTFVAQMITTLELFALEIRNRLKELEKATDVVGIMFIAEVDSDADTGGGYYKCHLQTLDATDWDTTTADQVDDKGDEVIVLNLPEMGGSTWSLSAGDLIQCFKFRDDEKNVRYVGVELLGKSRVENYIDNTYIENIIDQTYIQGLLDAIGVMHVYAWQSDHGSAGQYNCYRQQWTNGAWSNANTDNVVCKVVLEASGNAFGSGDYFIAVGKADASDVVPVIPYGYSYAY